MDCSKIMILFLTFKKKVVLLLAHRLRDVDVSLLASEHLSFTSMELNEQRSLDFLFQPSHPTFDSPDDLSHTSTPLFYQNSEAE